MNSKYALLTPTSSLPVITASLTSCKPEKISINYFMSWQWNLFYSTFFPESPATEPPTIYLINSKFMALWMQSLQSSSQILFSS